MKWICCQGACPFLSVLPWSKTMIWPLDLLLSERGPLPVGHWTAALHQYHKADSLYLHFYICVHVSNMYIYIYNYMFACDIYIYVCVLHANICVYIYICVCVCVCAIYMCAIYMSNSKDFLFTCWFFLPYCLCGYHCLSMCYLICYMQNYTQLELYIYKYVRMFFPNANFTNDNMPWFTGRKPFVCYQETEIK